MAEVENFSDIRIAIARNGDVTLTFPHRDMEMAWETFDAMSAQLRDGHLILGISVGPCLAQRAWREWSAFGWLLNKVGL